MHPESMPKSHTPYSVFDVAEFLQTRLQNARLAAPVTKPRILLGVSGLGRYALSSCVAAAMLAGCGGSQPPIGAPGAILQAAAIATHAEPGTSWMLPEAQNEDLLYVTIPGESSSGTVEIFSYPAGSQVGELSLYASELCSDTGGNVFITQGLRADSNSKIFEYKHGGTQPIATLSDAYKGALGCSVDPATGNLAVANTGGFDGTGNVLVYPNATGTPTVYQTPLQAEYCGYDGNSDLFAIGYEPGGSEGSYPLTELAKGGSQFASVRLDKPVKLADGVQWVGKYLVAGDGTNNVNNGRLQRYAIKGDQGISVKGVRLGVEASSFFIQGSTVLVPSNGGKVWFLSYPSGGREKSLSVNGPSAVTVSVAKSGSRIRK
jgi:hypothetical protein